MSPLDMHTAVDADDRCQAGGGSPKCAYGCRLSSCIRAALEAWDDCQCGSWALEGLEGGSREEVSWLASVNVNTCGVTGIYILVKSVGGPWQSCWLLVSSVVKSAVFFHRAGR